MEKIRIEHHEASALTSPNSNGMYDDTPSESIIYDQNSMSPNTSDRSLPAPAGDLTGNGNGRKL
jgi:hypothetical protein